MTPDELLTRARAICSHCCAPFSEVTDEHVAEAMGCFWDVLALAERQQEMLAEATARGHFYKDMMESKQQSFFIGDDAPDWVQHDHIIPSDLKIYMEEARRELSIQKRPRFTAEEKEAIERGMIALQTVDYDGENDVEDELRDVHAHRVLSKMLEEP